MPRATSPAVDDCGPSREIGSRELAEGFADRLGGVSQQGDAEAHAQVEILAAVHVEEVRALASHSHDRIAHLAAAGAEREDQISLICQRVPVLLGDSFRDRSPPGPLGLLLPGRLGGLVDGRCGRLGDRDSGGCREARCLGGRDLRRTRRRRRLRRWRPARRQDACEVLGQALAGIPFEVQQLYVDVGLELCCQSVRELDQQERVVAKVDERGTGLHIVRSTAHELRDDPADTRQYFVSVGRRRPGIRCRGRSLRGRWLKRSDRPLRLRPNGRDRRLRLWLHGLGLLGTSVERVGGSVHDDRGCTALVARASVGLGGEDVVLPGRPGCRQQTRARQPVVARLLRGGHRVRVGAEHFLGVRHDPQPRIQDVGQGRAIRAKGADRVAETNRPG